MVQQIRTFNNKDVFQRTTISQFLSLFLNRPILMNGNGKKPKFIHQIYDDKVCVEQVSKEWLLFTLCFSKVLFLSAALNKLEV